MSERRTSVWSQHPSRAGAGASAGGSGASETGARELGLLLFFFLLPMESVTCGREHERMASSRAATALAPVDDAQPGDRPP